MTYISPHTRSVFSRTRTYAYNKDAFKGRNGGAGFGHNDTQENSLRGVDSKHGVQKRILIVDDNRDLADTTRKMFELLPGQREVRTAYEGPRALKTAQAFMPDIIFLDIRMPSMNGYEVAKELRKSFPAHQKLLLVAVTGFGQETDKRRAKEAGFDLCLTKPVNIQTFMEIIKRES